MHRSKSSIEALRRVGRRIDRVKVHSDRGSASLEFITAGLILLLPVVYLVLTVAALQGASFAVEGAARQAARVFVQSRDDARGTAAAQRAIDFALADYGIARSASEVRVACSPRPDPCLARHNSVSVTVTVAVPLPLVPPALDVAVPVRVPLQASATQQVSRFWGTG